MGTKFILAAFLLASGSSCMGASQFSPDKIGFDKPKDIELAKAACTGNASAVARLVAEGANADAKSAKVGTVLIKAIQCQNVEGVEALLKSGADPNLSPRSGDWSPLMVASAFDSPSMIEVLVRAGANKDYVSKDTATGITVRNYGGGITVTVY